MVDPSVKNPFAGAQLIKRFLEIEVAARQVDHDHCVVEVR